MNNLNFEHFLKDPKMRRLLVEFIVETMQEYFSHNPQNRQREEWLPTETAYKALFLESAERLRIMRRQGFFRHKTDYRKEGGKYKFNISKCNERLTQISGTGAPVSTKRGRPSKK